MHRSGTSCLSGVLEGYGIFISKRITKKTVDNPFGNKEDPRVYRLNEKILNDNNYQWHSPPIESTSLKIKVSDRSFIKNYKAKLRNVSAEKIPLIKDPRMIYCLKFWSDDESQLIGTFRHPLAVIKSLRKRNRKADIPIDAEWIRTWIRYNRELLKIHDRHKFPLINFDWEKEHYMNATKKAIKLLIKSNGKSENSSFYSPKLIHHRVKMDSPIKSSYAKDIYEELLKRSSEG